MEAAETYECAEELSVVERDAAALHLRFEDDDLIDLVVVKPDQDAAGGPDQLHAAAAPVESPGVAINFTDLLGWHSERDAAFRATVEPLLESQLDRLAAIV